ncbi:MAG TPA: aldehyde dehydrogenase family protein, partial [Bacteroidia bacterium]
SNPIQNNEYGKIINQRHFNRLTSYLSDVNVIYGGTYDLDSCKIAPTIVEPKNIDSAIMNEEIFGPIMPIITFKTVEEVIAKVKSKSKPLALYIFSNKEAFTNQILQHTSSGGVCINDVIMHMTGASLPFGGVGDSGIGAYHGKFSFDTFSHKKAVLHRQFWLDAPLRYPPFNKIPLSLLKKLLKHVL